MTTDPVDSPRTGPVQRWIAEMLAARSLQKPDRRPLHRYCLSDEEYGEASTLLRKLYRDRRLSEPDWRSSALFVIFGSEWFRREASTTFRRWDELAPDIFPQLRQGMKAELTEQGLRYWGRELRRSERGREFLLTLALEGGIPVRVLQEGARGWLREYLGALMRRALSEPQTDPAVVRALAREEQWRLKESYHDEDFLELCVDLTLCILQWRRRAERELTELGAVGLDLVTFLDTQHHGWRDDVPIHMPAGEEGLAKDLLNGLLREARGRQAFGEVGATRLLVKRGDCWTPALLLAANGEISSRGLPSLDARDGRVRAVPTGALTKSIATAFALFDPPGAEGTTWRVRPRLDLSEPIEDVGFETPVTVELQQSINAPRPFLWPGGDAIRSDVLVFAEDTPTRSGRPRLRMIGKGSVRARQPRLHVLVPAGWRVAAEHKSELAQPELMPSLGAVLYEIDGPARVADPETEQAYLVEPNAAPEERSLKIVVTAPHNLDVEDPRLTLHRGRVDAKIQERGQERRPHVGEVLWRRPGGRFQDITRAPSAQGRIDIVWRDPQTGIQRDKLRLVVLPTEARLDGSMDGAARARIRVSGFDGWSIEPVVMPGRTARFEGDCIDIAFQQQITYRQLLRLSPPGGEEFVVSVRLTAREAAIVLADGRLAKGGERLALSDLRGAFAVSPGRATLHCDLSALGAPPTAWVAAPLDGEMPLARLRPLLEELLAIVPDQDATVRLSVRGQIGQPLRLQRYRLGALDCSPGTTAPAVRPGAPLRAIARALVDPQHEHELMSHPSLGLPDFLRGPCLVYLREGDDVVSRPVLHPAPNGLESSGAVPIAAATLEPDHATRQQLLLDVVSRIASGDPGTEADLNWLREASTTLRGLPAAAIDALALLREEPAALTRLLLAAADDVERRAIWRLERELPFLWLGLPLSAWRIAVEARFESINNALLAIPNLDATAVALDHVRQIRSALVGIEPATAAIMTAVGVPLGPDEPSPDEISDLRGLAMAHIRRSSDLEDPRGGHGHSPHPGPGRLAEAIERNAVSTPAELYTFSPHFHETLFAPVALAAAATGQMTLDPEEQWLVRKAIHADPDYVTAAHPLLLRHFIGAGK